MSPKIEITIQVLLPEILKDREKEFKVFLKHKIETDLPYLVSSTIVSVLEKGAKNDNIP